MAKWQRPDLDLVHDQVETSDTRRRYAVRTMIETKANGAAHCIRNRDVKMARAIYELDSVSRWAVTGTPIQNHLNDLSALLKFLRVYPYSEKRAFDSDISQLWKASRAEEAVKRLKALAGCLLLRRPRDTVKLPSRHDQLQYVEFLPAERDLYDQVRTHAIAQIGAAMLEKDSHRRRISFVNVLQQIEAMRMVCNLGMLYQTRHEAYNKADDTNTWQGMAQRGFNFHYAMGSLQCQYCHLDASADLLADKESTLPLFTQCLRYICVSCAQRPGGMGQVHGCGHTPTCLIAPVSTASLGLEEPSAPVLLTNIQGSGYLPIKVRVLIEDLQTLPRDVKW